MRVGFEAGHIGNGFQGEGGVQDQFPGQVHPFTVIKLERGDFKNLPKIFFEFGFIGAEVMGKISDVWNCIAKMVKNKIAYLLHEPQV